MLTKAINLPSKAMDLANNRAGLLAADHLRRKGDISEIEIDSAASEALKNKTLVVLHPFERKNK